MQVFVISKSTNSSCFIFQFASSTMHSRESSILLLGAEHVDVIGRCLLVCRDRSPIYTTLQYRILVSSKYCFLPSRCGCSCANAILLISCGVFRTSNAVILRRYLEVCPGVSSYLHVLTCRCDVPDFCSFFDWLLRTFHCTRHLTGTNINTWSNRIRYPAFEYGNLLKRKCNTSHIDRPAATTPLHLLLYRTLPAVEQEHISCRYLVALPTHYPFLSHLSSL